MENNDKLCKQSNVEKINKPMVVYIRSKDFGNGTGFFVTENLIVTNIHCVAGATSVSAKLLDSNIEYSVEGITTFDYKNDVVFLKVTGNGIPFPIADGDMVKVGENVRAVGCPNGNYVSCNGIVHTILNKTQWLQTTAKTSNGYSGGPLLNIKGQVIGIHFGSDNYYSTAISTTILKELLSHTHTVEPFDQWKERKQIRAFDYYVKNKDKIKSGNSNYDVIVDLDTTIRLNPDFIIAYTTRGDAKKLLAVSKIEEGDLVEAQQLLWSAIDDYTKAIRLCPDFVASYKGRGTARSLIGQSETTKSDLLEKQQLLQQAIDDFTQAINLFPAYALVYNNRADAKRHLVENDEKMNDVQTSQHLYQDAMNDINIAIEKQLNISIEEDPNVAVCYHTRGEIKEAMDDLTGAKDDYEKASNNNEYLHTSNVSDDLKRVKKSL